MLMVSSGASETVAEVQNVGALKAQEPRPAYWHFEIELSGFELDLHEWEKTNGEEFETELLMFKARVEKWHAYKNEKNTLSVLRSVETLVNSGAPKPGADFFEFLGDKK